MPNTRRHRRVRTLIAERQKFRCYYCGCHLRSPQSDGLQYPNTLTLDHVVPRSKGGTSRQSNLVAACRDCNGRKGDGVLIPVGVQA